MIPIVLGGFVIVSLLGLYTYFLYPLSFIILKKKSFDRDDNYQPKVSFIISVYNEAKGIREKLTNTLTIQYPRDKLEIIIADDGSEDETIKIVSEYPEILLLVNPHRGKSAAQNAAVEKATGEVLIFSDANTMYTPDAIQKLVRWFADPSIGCVCGELNYSSQSREKTYWNYERWVKRMESRKGSLLGANGGIYALRSDLYNPVPDDSISDFLEPIYILLKGYAVVYDSEARATEDSPKSVYQRKRRIILRSLSTLKYIWPRIQGNAKRITIYYEIIFHKLLRWSLPVGILLELFLCALLSSIPLFWILFQIQITIIGLSFLTQSGRYFWLVNGAAFIAWWDWFRGKKVVFWKVDRP
ncbi:MAG: glycosyltransferase family 2 protein [FCB group bacterium]|nr:glycosyltransferase family 2 protein [FCB group bacterium]